MAVHIPPTPSIFAGNILKRARDRLPEKTRSALPLAQSRDVFGGNRQHHHPDNLCHVARRRQGTGLVHRLGLALSLADGVLCHLRRGPGRGPRQGPCRLAAQVAHQDHGQASWRKPEFDSNYTLVEASQLHKGDCILVEAKDLIAGDGDVIAGAALVNESAVTGESAPVVRESGGDRSAVTGGTTVIANAIIVRITTDPGETFLDRMIALIEGAKRRKTPNEVALEVLLISLTLVFLLVCANISPLSIYSVKAAGTGQPVSLTVLVALFVCLAPTTIAALLPGHRHRRHEPALPEKRHRPVRHGPSRRRAMSTSCCSTKPAPSPSATGRRWPSSR